MANNFYRRHRRNCKAGLPKDTFNGEYEERQKGWKRCLCPISVSGKLGGRFIRKSTGVPGWDEARAIVAEWGAEVPEEVRQPRPEPPRAAGAITIERAATLFLASHDGSSRSTRRQYRYLLNALKAFSEKQGFILLSQWGPAEVQEFRASWKVSALTKTKKLATVKTFFEYGMTMGWLAVNPARVIKNPRGRQAADTTERIPFSDEELARMYKATERYNPRLGNKDFIWTGEDLSDFISISVYTGLRISDVATFHLGRMLPSGEIHVRTLKNGRKVFTWVPEWLQETIRSRARKFGPLIFGEHHTDNIDNITDLWRRKLKRLWAGCGPWPEEPTPHRFRHTFARILLQKPNVTFRDVAELLGNTEAVVRRHYAAWVPERQERLTSVLREAFEEKPAPGKVVAFSSRR